MGVSKSDGQALHPLLGVLAVFWLEDQRLVSGENFERFGDVAGAPTNFDAANLVHLYRRNIFVVLLEQRDVCQLFVGIFFPYTLERASRIEFFSVAIESVR